MDSGQVTRRGFLGETVKVAAGVAVGLGVAGAPRAMAAAAPAVDTSKILNYNGNMEYRRLGKTNLMVSAVCLGGHSRSDDKERYEVVSRCLDAGINYIDACSYGEVMRDSKALKGRRDKMYLALSHCENEVRNENFRSSKKLLESLDGLLKDSGQEYTDLWRITCFEPGGRHTFDTSNEIVDALEKAKKAGKIRHGGFSSHDRRWIRFMIEYFPQVEAVCFPFTTMSKTAPTDSLFDALQKCDVGAFGIKPFGAGSLFQSAGEEDDRRARLAIRYILLANTVVPIPGMNAPRQVENVAKAVKERRELDVKEQAELQGVSRQMWATLPPKYEWLRDWEYV
ncbi:MAG: aldo/keto reductase [Planctomycetes bacterium]|nr:aldo/keto reductase [Planctomycetota bacterium]